MEATGTMPTSITTGMPSTTFPTSTLTGVNPMSTTALSAMTGLPAMPAMTDMPSMLSMMSSSCKIDMLWNWYTIDACFLSHSWQIKSRGMFAGSCIGVICLVLCLEALRRLGKEYDAFILRRARQRQMYLDEASFKLKTDDDSTAKECHGIGIATLEPDSTLKQQENGCHQGASAIPATDCQDHIQPSTEASIQNASVEPQIAATTTNPSHETLGSHNKSPLITALPRIESTRVALSPRTSPSTFEDIHHRPSLVEQLVRALLHTLQFGAAYIIMLLAMYYNGYIIICIFIGAFLGSFIFSWEQISLNKQNDACQVTKCCD